MEIIGCSYCAVKDEQETEATPLPVSGLVRILAAVDHVRLRFLATFRADLRRTGTFRFAWPSIVKLGNDVLTALQHQYGYGLQGQYQTRELGFFYTTDVAKEETERRY